MIQEEDKSIKEENKQEEDLLFEDEDKDKDTNPKTLTESLSKSQSNLYLCIVRKITIVK